MSLARQKRPEVPEPIKRLKELLKDAEEFSEVSHARERWGPDGGDTSPIPSMLVFEYRRAGFFASWGTSFEHRNGRMMLAIPTGKMSNPRFGPLNMDLDDAAVIVDLKKLLDPHICSPIVISEYGDRMSFTAEHSDETKIGHNYPRHVGCFGNFKRHNISEAYSALNCTSCNLRVIFPANLSTVGDLRKWAKQFPSGDPWPESLKE